MYNLVGDVKANPRDFYRYINSQKNDIRGIPPLKRKNGKGVAQSDLEKTEEFNDQFTDVFNKNEHTQVPLLDRSAPFMNDNAVSKDGVIKLLKGLNPSKALGPDELHPRVLKELATELSPVFAHLFQQSIDTGEISKEWSLANITPLFKKSDRSLVCNYRPVSLSYVPCKLLEHIVFQISWLVLININSCQIGNMHSGKDIVVIGLKSWTIEDRLTHSYWILKRHLIHPLMNSLKANCLAMELVAIN